MSKTGCLCVKSNGDPGWAGTFGKSYPPIYLFIVIYIKKLISKINQKL